MRLEFRVGERLHTVVLEREPEDPARLRAHVDGAQRHVEVLRCAAGRLEFTVDGRRHGAALARDGDRRFLRVDGGPVLDALVGEAATERPAAGGGADQLTAVMHGQVVSVEVQPGAVVRRGETLVVLEAMKMEMRVTAPHDGTVARLDCAAGEVVERGRLLVVLEPLAG